ncbi:MSP domain-containing protein [Aphelenchoides fujianensis]|nr:MSP domain-containing protein [Aphelenchoides fujianensis]
MDASTLLKALVKIEDEEDAVDHRPKDDLPGPFVELRPRIASNYEKLKDFDGKTALDKWAASHIREWNDSSQYTRDRCKERAEAFSCSTAGCPKRRRVVYAADSADIKLDDSTVGHDHTAREPPLIKRHMPAIRQHFARGLKPRAIRKRLLEANNNKTTFVPSLLQVQNAVKRLRRKGGKQVPLTVAALPRAMALNTEPSSASFPTAGGTAKHEVVKSANGGHFCVKLAYSYVPPKGRKTPELIRPPKEEKLVVQWAKLPAEEEDPQTPLEAGQLILPLKTK